MTSEIPSFANFSNIPNNTQENLQTPNQNNISPGQERQKSWGNAVSRSQTTRKGTQTIRSVRAGFQNFLRQNGMDLVTSALEFQENGDFIASSYIIYTNHNNYKVPLGQFLGQYPQFVDSCVQIRDYLRQVQNQIQVNTRGNFNPNLDSNFRQF